MNTDSPNSYLAIKKKKNQKLTRAEGSPRYYYAPSPKLHPAPVRTHGRLGVFVGAILLCCPPAINSQAPSAAILRPIALKTKTKKN